MKEITGKDFSKRIGSIIIFKYLKPGELATIFTISRFYRFEKDEKIIAKGGQSPDLYAVMEGTVNVVVPDAKSESVFISSIGEGDVFGEAGIFLSVKRTADVVSADSSIVLRIGRQDMITFIKKYPDAGIKILMLIIYSLLKKLKEANLELAFERKADISQGDIDAMVEDMMKE
jgi:CRP/FNR family transcriptional regulator, cyclic AMP receptor protein